MHFNYFYFYSLRDEVTNHLDNVQDELESLKDLLRTDGYSLDASTLLGVSMHKM